RAQVHPQLDPRREALASGPAGCGGRVLARSLGGGAESDTVGGAALRGEALPKKRCRMKRCRVRGSAVVGNAFLGLAVFGNAALLSCAPAKIGRASCRERV